MFACRVWGLRSTDIMQGVVYGTRIDEMGDDERLLTRFDFDQSFGTAINRFCCQAVVGEPISPFGKGHQKRGFLRAAGLDAVPDHSGREPARPGRIQGV